MRFAVHMQCYRNEVAVQKCVEMFRKIYPSEKFRLVSDNGSDFQNLATKHDLVFEKKPENILPKGKLAGKNAVLEYLHRIHETCMMFDSEWIVLFEEDVRTKCEIISFPITDAAGVADHPYYGGLDKLVCENSPCKGYGMAGGSIFKRSAFLACYENISKFDVEAYERMDGRVTGWTDIPLTLFFQVNGFTYSTWNGVEEPSAGVYRLGSAFEHNYKAFYEKV